MTLGSYDSALYLNQVVIDRVKKMPDAKDLEIVLYLNREYFITQPVITSRHWNSM